MEKKSNKIKENLATGASPTLGAVGGVVAGSVISEHVSAADAVPAEDVEVVEQPGTNHTPQDSDVSAQEEPVNAHPENVVSSHEPTHGPASEQPQESTHEPASGSEQLDPDVKVVSYDTVTNDDGSQMDVAVVSVDGQGYIIADTDMDGEANMIASDLNGNGQLDQGEMADISDQHIAMQPYHDAFDTPVADDPGMCYEPDYTNDANVDSFMA